ncbi:MAG: sigma-54-dependent Fis family transcriptional regulator [Deltaproteobacteria bacterium HGW-Deltaproteobacteria-6]|jgi:DNA-binding NtrC family response regulator|nr:MAG: sigma-54-dependent Fis family transcriptional regulator [Deltaproteobacteria bacterium HGW-Deltaproteobacteria-6]
MNSELRILVVDDKASFRFLVTEFLADAGYQSAGAGSADEALQELARLPYDLIISDLVMPDADGIELLRTVHRRWPELPFILITAHGSVESAVAAMKEGADDYLLKPLNREELLVVVGRLLENTRIRAGHARMLAAQKEKFSFQNIRSVSPAMGIVLKSAEQVAAHPRTTVAIYGESGVGKEVLARAIHLASGQDLTTFIPVNCAAIPETLLESELFGHVKGAFTGADREREGKCARARTGTLFLDEIGDMPLALQTKLLRLLEERVYEKVGADTPLAADFRVIIATHRNLEERCREGAFRLDLFHRLNTFPLALPPLRERREDIPQLSEHFLGIFRNQQGKHLPGLSSAALNDLCAYDWPGNIRELRNRLEYAAIVTNGELIQPEHLNLGLVSHDKMPAGDRIVVHFDFAADEFSLDAVHGRLTAWAMDRTNQNKSAAARLLKTTRKIFY